MGGLNSGVFLFFREFDGARFLEGFKNAGSRKGGGMVIDRSDPNLTPELKGYGNSGFYDYVVDGVADS